MPPQKRNLEETQFVSRRRSARVSSTKSSYFEDQDDEDESESPPHKTTKTAAAQAPSKSRRRSQNRVSDDDDDQYEEDNLEDEDNGDSDIVDPDDEDDSETPPPKPSLRVRPPANPGARSQKGTPKAKSSTGAKKKGRPAGAAQASPKTQRRGQGARNGDENDDGKPEDDDESDEPKVTFIPLPKLRDTKGVEYEDTTIHPNTLLFLGDLKANNKRAWLKMHDPEYRRSLKDWESFVETLTDKIIEADETIPELPLKDVIFRIYRDIRFSKDPTPYKPHYSAAWSRTGRKGPYACYYVHVEPGNCLVGGGLWHPEGSALAKLRASVDERPHRIRRVLTDPEFVRTFLPHVMGKKEDKVLRAFADKNQENALKTKPKGFNPDHRDIQLLKLRNYTIGRTISEEDLHGSDAQDKIMEVIRAMVPFVTFLNNVVMPDPDMDSDSDEEDVDDQACEDEEDDEDDEDGENSE
ncbi:hypothetical protein F4808DRAFT_144325 [Astrocystis sublimbata]|nr:hypothetical protein F4808DRAFT_144325 [Astrocystis sublimbata]